MSENRNRGIKDFSKYDAMTTEELEEILRLDADAPEGEESDTEFILYVMGVLADRRRNSCHSGKTAHEAYESFKQNYIPEDENIEIAPEAEKKSKNIPLRWLRGLTATAAVLVLLFLGSITASAFGVDIWGAIAKWTKETFHFTSGDQIEVDEPNPDSELPYASLQEALSQTDRDPNIVPTAIPDGYMLNAIKIDETPLQKTYMAFYENGEKTIKITVRSYINSYPEQIEKSDGFVEAYESADVIYYIFSNQDRIQAVWTKDLYECHILGDLTIDELKMMIDSIEKG